MNTTELKEVFRLLEHENIHLSENNSHITFVGRYISTNINLVNGIFLAEIAKCTFPNFTFIFSRLK